MRSTVRRGNIDDDDDDDRLLHKWDGTTFKLQQRARAAYAAGLACQQPMLPDADADAVC
jgi:hypothetical protein